ncbi:MAG: ABC transporter permease subunit [Mycoplasmatales bacterium]
MKNLKKNLPLLTIAIPGIIIVILIKYIPLPGMYLAFVDYVGKSGGSYWTNLFSSNFVGLEKFKFLFTNPDMGIILRNTIGYNLIFIILGLIVAVFTAILMKEMLFNKSKKTLQTMMFFPFFMSWISISFMMKGFLDAETGIFNQILIFFGQTPIEWYNTAYVWPFILIFMGIWKGIGYNSVIYLSAITSIDDSYYEAAVIDGASKWQQIKKITIPSIKPLMIILTILGVGGMMYSDFGLFYQLPLNSSALYSVTTTLDVFVYNALKSTGNIELSAAASFFQSMIGFILVIATNAIVKKIDKDKALF